MRKFILATAAVLLASSNAMACNGMGVVDTWINHYTGTCAGDLGDNYIHGNLWRGVARTLTWPQHQHVLRLVCMLYAAGSVPVLVFGVSCWDPLRLFIQRAERLWQGRIRAIESKAGLRRVLPRVLNLARLTRRGLGECICIQEKRVRS